MRRGALPWAVLFAVMAGALLVWLLFAPAHLPTAADNEVQVEAAGPGRDHKDSKSAGAGPGKQAAPAPPAAQTALRDELRKLVEALAAGTNAARAKKSLEDLKSLVHGAPPDEAAARLIEVLESGIDYPTGLEFVVGAEGVMEETPTLRTALMDLLGQTEPFVSADYSRRILSSTGSADEYAIAMRNVAWSSRGEGAGRELRGYFAKMLGRTDWRTNPTDGFLEAFDLAVVTRAVTELSPAIEASPTAGAEDRIGNAAFVAMDRIMLAEPTAVLAAFARDTDFLAQAPMHRASILSRLDVRQPAQAALLKQYLMRPDLAAEELAYFARTFPNGNRFVSHRLVTLDEPGGSIAEMAALDQSTLATVQTWLSDPQLSRRQAELSTIAARLRNFTQPSPAGAR